VGFGPRWPANGAGPVRPAPRKPRTAAEHGILVVIAVISPTDRISVLEAGPRTASQPAKERQMFEESAAARRLCRRRGRCSSAERGNHRWPTGGYMG
jgi:hypothetical protein